MRLWALATKKQQVNLFMWQYEIFMYFQQSEVIPQIQRADSELQGTVHYFMMKMISGTAFSIQYSFLPHFPRHGNSVSGKELNCRNFCHLNKMLVVNWYSYYTVYCTIYQNKWTRQCQPSFYYHHKLLKLHNQTNRRYNVFQSPVQWLSLKLYSAWLQLKYTFYNLYAMICW